MKANEIANTHWQNKDATNALAELVMEMLSESEPMGTTRLVGKLLPSASTKQTKALLSHLYNARVAGLLDGYWTQGKPNGGTFGKPSYQWHAKRAMTSAERIAWMKEHDPEGYAKYYAPK